MERTERIAALLDDLSVEDLRRTTLQAIDHAFKASAEVAEARAMMQGALGTIAELRDENAALKARLDGQGDVRVRTALAVRSTAARSARWARRRIVR